MANEKTAVLSRDFYELSKELRRKGDDGEHSLLLLLIRNSINTFSDLHSRCRYAPKQLLKCKGVGPITAANICRMCRDFTGIQEGECSDERAMAPEDTLLGMQERGQLGSRAYTVLSKNYTTLEQVCEGCGGSSENFGRICEGLSAKGMQEVCQLCDQHMSSRGTSCPYILERGDLECDQIPQVYINNLMRALGVSYEEAMWVLRYGTSYK